MRPLLFAALVCVCVVVCVGVESHFAVAAPSRVHESFCEECPSFVIDASGEIREVQSEPLYRAESAEALVLLALEERADPTPITSSSAKGAVANGNTQPLNDRAPTEPEQPTNLKCQCEFIPQPGKRSIRRSKNAKVKQQLNQEKTATSATAAAGNSTAAAGATPKQRQVHKRQRHRSKNGKFVEAEQPNETQEFNQVDSDNDNFNENDNENDSDNNNNESDNNENNNEDDGMNNSSDNDGQNFNEAEDQSPESERLMTYNPDSQPVGEERDSMVQETPSESFLQLNAHGKQR